MDFYCPKIVKKSMTQKFSFCVFLFYIGQPFTTTQKFDRNPPTNPDAFREARPEKTTIIVEGLSDL